MLREPIAPVSRRRKTGPTATVFYMMASIYGYLRSRYQLSWEFVADNYKVFSE